MLTDPNDPDRWMSNSSLDRNTLLIQLSRLEAEIARRGNYKWSRYYPDEGPLRRELYRGAVEFFSQGDNFPERLTLGGNRTGKTESAAYEVTCHLTGIYPDWWIGKRFTEPTEWWTAGDTATTTRDIQQLALYGPLREAPRTGMIPAHLIQHTSPKNAIPNALETIWVKHISGGTSTIAFKSYDQRRESFQGTAKHGIWLDEECPDDVYVECLLRTLTCKGIVIVTFTPVEGLTPFVQNWLEHAVMLDGDRKVPAEKQIFGDAAVEDVEAQGKESTPIEDRTKLLTLVSWDEVPHLDEQARNQMLSSIPVYQRAARTRGIPNLGSGVIYPIPEEEIKVKPFDIPPHWRKGYGMDVGWNWTVAIHAAYDAETQTYYLYREHVRSHAEPVVHVDGIKAPGDWIPGRIDPAANGRSQVDGRQLLQTYIDLGLRLDVAPNGVEAGIYEVWTALTAGRIKVFSSLTHFFTEYRMYRRDAKGRVVKKNDHLMDALRYLIASGIGWLALGPNVKVRLNRTGRYEVDPFGIDRPMDTGSDPLSWMS
jgi:phage terminase large subunit-like protein